MKIRLLYLDGRVVDVDRPIGFRTSGNGRRCSPRNPWPVDYIGTWPDVLPGEWKIVGDSKTENRLLVHEVSQ